MSARHPTPWTQTDFLVGKGKKKRVEWSSITDARNEFVVESLDEETAQEIVEAVNGFAHLRQALTKIRDLANRDTDESMLAVSTRNNLMGHIANFALKGIEP